MRRPSYYAINGFLWLSYKMRRLAIHLTKWTGKSRVAVHPKHLLGMREDMYWYLPFLKADDEILDVGCGNGMHTLKAATRVRKAVGIELNERNHQEALELQRLQKAGNVEFQLGSAVVRALPFETGRFDKVICMDVLEHVHERQPLLREIRRVLKADGVLIFSVPSSESRWRARLRRAGVFSYSDPDHKIEYTRESLLQELRSGGFEPVEWFADVYDTPWVGFIDLIGGFSLRIYERLQEWKVAKGRRYPQEAIGFKVLCRPVQPAPG